MDETLEDAASVEEQPASEAVESTPSASPETPVTPEASAEQPSASSRMFAGKYTSPDELERAYLESQREASRMAGELSALRRTPEKPAASEPKWKQLESERNKWASQLRNPNLDEQARWEADNQVRLYDREIAYERAKHDMSAETTRTTAQKRLEQDSTTILSKYEQDLNNQQSPLYVAASDRFNQLVEAGYPMDINTKALAVAYAATVTNTNVTKAVQQNRTAMLKTLNTQVKQAVIAGAGGPATVKAGGISAKDIENMSDAEFAKYERGLAGV